jgi:hypothetical protein
MGNAGGPTHLLPVRALLAGGQDGLPDSRKVLDELRGALGIDAHVIGHYTVRMQALQSLLSREMNWAKLKRSDLNDEMAFLSIISHKFVAHRLDPTSCLPRL